MSDEKKLTIDAKLEALKLSVSLCERAAFPNRFWSIANYYGFFLDLLLQSPSENIDFKKAYNDSQDILNMLVIVKALEFARLHPDVVYGVDADEFLEVLRDLPKLYRDVRAASVDVKRHMT